MITRVVIFWLVFCTVGSAAQLFPTNSTWRFFRGTNEASSPDNTAWRNPGFDESAFTEAPAPFWYGDFRPGGTQLLDMQNNYTCLFLRKQFTLNNAQSIGGLRLTYFIDDGFVLWINGVEVYRENMVGTSLSRTNLATNQAIDPSPVTQVMVTPPGGALLDGVNVVAVQVFNTSAGSSDLGFDLSLETIVAETTPPSIVAVTPPPGSVTSLNQITVAFSEPVVGVDPDDLLINTQPAMSVSGSGTTYTFTFGQPLYGAVAVSWFGGHGITDEAFPPNPFDEAAPGATWLYNLVDVSPPVVSGVFPSEGATVRSLSRIEVTFNEEVSGVSAGDLLINSQPATNVFRIPGGAYIFEFTSPSPGAVNVQWAPAHSIVDQASSPNPFAGGAWSYVLNPSASVGDLVLNEILASNQSGLWDEDGQEQDWIEIYNRGPNTVDLRGWSLSDDPSLPGLWTFGNGSIAPGEYLVVFASGKDRRSAAGTNRFHTNFQLSQDGEYLGLYSPDSPRTLVSGFQPEFPEQRNDYSFGVTAAGVLRYFAVPTPGATNGSSTLTDVCEPVHFSAARGHFTQPFNLVLTTPTPGATIRYTLDGTEPTALNGRVYVSELRVTNTTLIRAAAFRLNALPSTVETHSYFFNLSPGIRSLPTISIVTATSNLVGRTGILGMAGGGRASDGLYITNNPATDYHNPSAHGLAWERPVSVEYIKPQDNSGFQIDCGIRVQGSDWQRPRTTATSKFSFRLYFRSDYGKGRLEYPIFPLTPAQDFDQLVLRAGFNDNSNPFVRDELTRRLSHDMGQVASHGGFAVVFTNGIYAGYYNPTERVHEEFMQSYLGGGSEWDVVAPSFATSASGLGVVDGDRNDFHEMMTNVWRNNVLLPVTNQVRYLAVANRVDLPNFADYCLLNAYAAMGDWPANNWRAARERVPNALWRFIVWDAEWANGFDTKTPTYDTFAQTGTGTLDAGLNSTVNSEIARLYQSLRANPEFRLLWADRIHKHFFNGGALTSLSVSNRLQQMRTELQSLINMTDTEFLNWHRDRLPPLFIQFNNYGLYGYSNSLYGVYASSNAPVFSQHGGSVAPGFSLSMTAPLGGTIYYTTNGHDPRVPFSGAVSNAAVAYANPLTLSASLPIKARTLLNGTNWSALADATFNVGFLGIPLRISEIMYNPPGGSVHEYIEIQNIGGSAVDLAGIHFDGITFTFGQGANLAAGARLVLANNTDPAAFAARYPGVEVAGYFSGGLNNSGERLALLDPSGGLITSVDFRDSGGWPIAADGQGAALEVINAFGDPDDPSNWQANLQVGGTPGLANSTPPSLPAVRFSEVMAENISAVNNAGTFPDYVELFNASGAAANLAGWSLTDDTNPRRFVFPNGTEIPASGRLVVWLDSSTNTSPGLHAGFALDRDGDSLHLYNVSTSLVDSVTLGLQLPNYSVGRIGADWVLNQPTPNLPNAAAPVGSVANVVINEWLANPPAGLPDWIELYNSGTLPVSLRGTYLMAGAVTHPIASLSFVGPRGHVLFFADETPGANHLDFKLPAAGTSIVFHDASATQIDAVSYTNSLEGVSRGRLPDGTSTLANFAGSASPGASNYVNTYSGPVLNEVLARNQSVTNSGRVADFIEIFNGTAAPFDLSGMSLSINTPQAGEWIFPPGTSLAAGAYLVVWCDPSQPPSAVGPGYNTGEALDGESGGAFLFNAAGQLVDSVNYGFQIPDRSIGRVAGQWTLTSTPTPGAVNSAAATFGATSALRINEWMANPASGPDWLELFNTSASIVNLSGLLLTDDPSGVGLVQFRVGPLSFIAPSGFVRWIADGDPEAGWDHLPFNLNDSGESVHLYTTNATSFVLINAAVFGAQPRGVSQGRLPDGNSNAVAFANSPSPGESNYLPAPVIINEVLTSAAAPAGNGVELFNPTSSGVGLGGWFLSDGPENFKKYRIPDGTTIPAGGYLMIGESQFGNNGAGSFALSGARSGELWLSAADAGGTLTGVRAVARFGPAAANVSFVRVVTTLEVEYAAASQVTSGAANAAPLIGPVVLNEILYNPASPAPAEEEFIELHNRSGASVSLFDPAFPTNTWRIAGGVEFKFPQGQTLNAGAYLLVVGFDPANAPAVTAFRSRYNIAAGIPIYGPFSGRLDNAGEDVQLLRPNAPQPQGSPLAGYVSYFTADHVRYRDSAPWPAGGVDGGGLSLQRRAASLYGNEPVNWLGALPTPGGANGAAAVTLPSIVAGPQPDSVLEGEPATFNVSAAGGVPLQFQWRFNGINVPDATNATFQIHYPVLEDDGAYDVVVSNPGGSAVSAAARLRVDVPPMVLIPPAELFVRPATNVILSVLARGSVPLRYQWRLNGVNLPNETNSFLPRNNVQLADDGEYDVLIENAVGATLATGRIVVLINPAVLVNPISQSVPLNSRVTLSVTASGNPLPFTFEWRKGSVPIETHVVNSRTDFFTFTATNAAVAETYRVVVKNLASFVPGAPSAFATITTLPDTDVDGLPDDWETQNGFNPGVAGDQNVDSDLDGLTNGEEYLAGTNPTDPLSYLRIDLGVNGQAAQLSLMAVSPRTYSVQYSDDLGSGLWQKLGDIGARTTNRVETLSDPQGGPGRFYRLVTPQQP